MRLVMPAILREAGSCVINRTALEYWTGDTMLSTQYRALLNSAGWTTLHEIDDTMGIEDLALQSWKSAPSRLPKAEKYLLAMACIEGEWYATPVLSFWAKVPSLSACFLMASMAGS